jgi:hypothetical protein
LIAVNDMNKTMKICEIKRNPSKINLSDLKIKAAKIVESKSNYTIEYIGYSLLDI